MPPGHLGRRPTSSAAAGKAGIRPSTAILQPSENGIGHQDLPLPQSAFGSTGIHSNECESKRFDSTMVSLTIDVTSPSVHHRADTPHHRDIRQPRPAHLGRKPRAARWPRPEAGDGRSRLSREGGATRHARRSGRGIVEAARRSARASPGLPAAQPGIDRRVAVLDRPIAVRAGRHRLYVGRPPAAGGAFGRPTHRVRHPRILDLVVGWLCRFGGFRVSWRVARTDSILVKAYCSGSDLECLFAWAGRSTFE
jgi:hypothetical protein